MNKPNGNTNSVKLENELNLLNDFEPTLYAKWKQKIIIDLKGADFDSTLKTLTYEGIKLSPIYVDEDLKTTPFANELPGFADYLRGTKPAGYLTGGWQIAQTINTDNPQKYNQLLLNGLKNGQTTILLDESENRFCNSQEDAIKNYLRNVDIGKYPINIFCDYSAKYFLSEFENFVNQQKINLDDLTGGIYSSPISFLIKNGYLPNNLEKTFDELNSLANLIHKKNAKLRTILIDASIYNNAGSNAVQDLAFSLASGSEYIYRLANLGTDVNQIAEQISFKFGIGSFYFMEIAKLRAAKVLWSKILEEYGVDAEYRKMHIIAQTTMYNLATRDIHNNILRGTTEAFSAILGGIDVLDVTPFDKHISAANEFSLHLARNIQNILKEETHLDKVIDTSGGSYYLEKLTDELCTKAWSLFQEVEDQGGIIDTLKSNFVQNKIAEINTQRLADYSDGKSIIVGANKYVNEKEIFKNIKKQPSNNDLSLNKMRKAFEVEPIGYVHATEQFEK